MNNPIPKNGMFNTLDNLLQELRDNNNYRLSKAKDDVYGPDYDAGRVSKKFNSALDHIKSYKYKVNHNGGGDEDTVDHEKPDVTLHYAYGDDEPSSYTLHYDGAAAKDKVLKIKHLKVKD